MLIVCPRGSWLATAFRGQSGVELRFVEDVTINALADGAGSVDRGFRRHRVAIVHAPRARVRSTRDVIERIERLIEPGGTVAIYVDHENGELDPSNFTSELAQYVGDILPSNWMQMHMSAAFVGGEARRKNHQRQRRVLAILSGSRRRRIVVAPIAFAALAVIGVRTAIQNLRFGRPSSVCPQYCSSALLTLEGFAPGGAGSQGSDDRSVPHSGRLDRAQPIDAKP